MATNKTDVYKMDALSQWYRDNLLRRGVIDLWKQRGSTDDLDQYLKEYERDSMGPYFRLLMVLALLAIAGMVVAGHWDAIWDVIWDAIHSLHSDDPEIIAPVLVGVSVLFILLVCADSFILSPLKTVDEKRRHAKYLWEMIENAADKISVTPEEICIGDQRELEALARGRLVDQAARILEAERDVEEHGIPGHLATRKERERDIFKEMHCTLQEVGLAGGHWDEYFIQAKQRLG
ncbi:MAG: hypothetical protein WDZ79_01455 [Candidatus Paceibacterota bacterium]